MPAVLQTLDNQQARLERIVLAELLHRGLYLHRFAMKHGYIMDPSAETTPAKLVETASQIITSSIASASFVESIGLSLEEIMANDQFDVPLWKMLTSHLSLDDFEVPTADFHLRVSSRMSTHLVLTFENIDLPQWWAAALLSTQPSLAQEAACALHEYLKRKPTHELSAFDRALRLDDVLWAELGNFGDALPAVLLWRGHGAFRNLFTFLAARFLGNKDSVLGAEGIHSRWQDLIRKKHSVKHPLLNAILKISFSLHEGGGLPDLNRLLAYFTQCRGELAVIYRGVCADGGVAPKMRRRQMFVERFNLSAHDASLLKGPAAVNATDARPEVRWANYCRSVLKPLHFYAFQSLTAGMFLFVGENKSLPGRAEREESDALGRSFGVVWFEKVDEVAGSIFVRRIAHEGPHIELHLQSPAEILRAAGFTLPVQDQDSARDVELALEATFMEHWLVRFEHSRETSAGEDPFIFTLTNPNDAEKLLWGETPPQELTKMGLARRAEVERGMNRKECYANMDKEELVLLFDAAYVPPAPKGKGKGKGPGRGGGGGGGRGGRRGGRRARGGRGRGGRS